MANIENEDVLSDEFQKYALLKSGVLQVLQVTTQRRFVNATRTGKGAKTD